MLQMNSIKARLVLVVKDSKNYLRIHIVSLLFINKQYDNVISSHYLCHEEVWKLEITTGRHLHKWSFINAMH